ncbi:hypothetical protein ACIQGZ_04930 [Streptomyces sp. NPDC092296]|uniref:hypothetical protein n=1 Tax=Streptomyces sp. NPDC092296 TaxID=3366012 RepID=UPI00381C0AF0
MPTTEAAVVDLIRASLEPASRAAVRRMDSPACRVVSEVLRGDMRDGGTDGIVFLAVGTAIAAAVLTETWADAQDQGAAHFLDAFAATLPPGERTLSQLPPVLRSFLVPGERAAHELLAEIWIADQENFFDVVVAFGDFAANLITALAYKRIRTVDESFEQLESTLRIFAGEG